MQFLEKILEYIFLPTCGVCGKLGEGYLCKFCEKLLEEYIIFEDNCLNNISNKNKRKKEKLLKNKYIEKRYIFKYKALIRNLILQYKFNDKAYLYKTFCEIIVNNKNIFDFIKSYDIIIPVPIHKKRKKKRGYNQSELIAKELAKKLELKICTDVLIKIKNNKVQSTLNEKERKENTKNVYKLINSEKILNKKVLIFDDIYTTGATTNSCIEVLKKANVKKIGVLTLAKD